MKISTEGAIKTPPKNDRPQVLINMHVTEMLEHFKYIPVRDLRILSGRILHIRKHNAWSWWNEYAHKNALVLSKRGLSKPRLEVKN
jgi:hypothetical protein